MPYKLTLVQVQLRILSYAKPTVLIQIKSAMISRLHQPRTGVYQALGEIISM
jgi:hypothetical protein